jgi:alcohol dehydrogenase (cytochrome c)
MSERAVHVPTIMMYAIVGAVTVSCASRPAVRSSEASESAAGWPSYNRTLSSERFAPLASIRRDNVATLRQVCVYDLGIDVSFQTGPIVVGSTLYATSETETVAIDAGDCKQVWRVRETVAGSYLKVNRGVAYLDGRLFRGLQDGRVVAYDAATGRTLWQTRIADSTKGESVPAAPIAWGGLVFIGQAGGDNKGVKGRMYALDAATGRQVWETYLVPREVDRRDPTTQMGALAARSWHNPPDVEITGGATWTSYTLDPRAGLLFVPGGNAAPDFIPGVRPGDNLFSASVVVLDARTGRYVRHFSLVPEDFHDWDVSAAPSLVTTRAGRYLMAVAPKDGQLYGFDLATSRRLYATPITTRENVTAPLTKEGTRFCPGSQGGSEWNGPAFSPRTNLVYTGTVDWCTTVKAADPAAVKSVAAGQPWTGSSDPKHPFGEMDPKTRWAGWVTATDADTGVVKWQFKTAAPVLAAVTPTAGGIVFAADMDGDAFAFDDETGSILWQTGLDGAAGGGIITYTIRGRQRVAFVAGTNSPIWPVEHRTAKIVVFGLP